MEEENEISPIKNGNGDESIGIGMTSSTSFRNSIDFSLSQMIHEFTNRLVDGNDSAFLVSPKDVEGDKRKRASSLASQTQQEVLRKLSRNDPLCCSTPFPQSFVDSTLSILREDGWDEFDKEMEKSIAPKDWEVREFRELARKSSSHLIPKEEEFRSADEALKEIEQEEMEREQFLQSNEATFASASGNNVDSFSATKYFMLRSSFPVDRRGNDSTMFSINEGPSGMAVSKSMRRTNEDVVKEQGISMVDASVILTGTWNPENGSVNESKKTRESGQSGSTEDTLQVIDTEMVSTVLEDVRRRSKTPVCEKEICEFLISSESDGLDYQSIVNHILQKLTLKTEPKSPRDSTASIFPHLDQISCPSLMKHKTETEVINGLSLRKSSSSTEIMKRYPSTRRSVPARPSSVNGIQDEKHLLIRKSVPDRPSSTSAAITEKTESKPIPVKPQAVRVPVIKRVQSVQAPTSQPQPHPILQTPIATSAVSMSNFQTIESQECMPSSGTVSSFARNLSPRKSSSLQGSQTLPTTTNAVMMRSQPESNQLQNFYVPATNGAPAQQMGYQFPLSIHIHLPQIHPGMYHYPPPVGAGPQHISLADMNSAMLTRGQPHPFLNP